MMHQIAKKRLEDELIEFFEIIASKCVVEIKSKPMGIRDTDWIHLRRRRGGKVKERKE